MCKMLEQSDNIVPPSFYEMVNPVFVTHANSFTELIKSESHVLVFIDPVSEINVTPQTKQHRLTKGSVHKAVSFTCLVTS